MSNRPTIADLHPGMPLFDSAGARVGQVVALDDVSAWIELDTLSRPIRLDRAFMPPWNRSFRLPRPLQARAGVDQLFLSADRWLHARHRQRQLEVSV